MKILFVYFILSFIGIEVNAESVDTLLLKEYKRGYEYVYELIESGCLKDSLTNRSFCSLFFENLWTITVKNEKSYVLYYGYQIGKEEVTRKEISNRDLVFNRLFTLDINKNEGPIYKPTDFYTPIYWYFVLVDSLQNKRFEWNSNSKSDDDYSYYFSCVFADYYACLMNIILYDQYNLEKRASDLWRKSRKNKR